MGFSVAQTYLSDILHVVSQALLIPVIIALLLFIAYALYSIGSIISEYFNERRHFKVVMPKFLAALMAAKQDEVPKVIEESGLLRRQKTALLTAYDYRMLPGDALIALIKRLVSEEESRYDRIRARNNMAARISPMIGLMGTLIPLGPGIEALGRADTAALSSSLLIAFDTTVAGLVVAAICLAVGKIRGNWYDNYLSALDAAMATMLEKIEDMRGAGEITTEEPSDYAFMFESTAETAASAKAAAEEEKAAAEEAAAVQAAAKEAAAKEAAAAEAAAWEAAAAEAAAREAAAKEAAAAEAAAKEAAAREAAAAEAAAAEIVAKEAAARELAAAEAAAAEAAAQETAAQETAHELDFHFEPPRRPWE